MFSKLKLLLTISILIGLLAACGTGNNSEQNNGSKNENPTNGSEIEVEQEEQVGHSNETENNDHSNTDVEKERKSEQTITYKVGDETKEETALLKESDNQDFSLYVLPTYVLTAEEPNKDSVYFEADGNQFMRIELLPNDTDLDHAIDTMKEQLTTVSESVEEKNLGEEYSWLQNAHVFQSDNQEDLITGLLVKQEKHLLKVTIFTKINDSHLDRFLRMAETIE